MKLLRFELKEEPGEIRSGIVSMGRVYETKDGEAAGVHDAQDVRPLIPIYAPRSVRVFRQAAESADLTPFSYANPSALVGPSQSIPFPPHVGVLFVETFLAVAIVGRGYRLEPDQADDVILGFSLAVAATTREQDGRRYDPGIALGPVLTTPDEFEDWLIGENAGRDYSLDATLRINSVDRAIGQTSKLPLTAGQAIAAASLSCPIREGDLFLIGPLVEPILIEPDDEITLAVEALGALSLKISSEL